MSGRKSSSWRKKAYQRVVDRDGAACALCFLPERTICRKGGVYGRMDTGDWRQCVILSSNLELDHRHPLHLGGTNDDDNLWLLCGPCHRRKTSEEQSARLKALGAGRNAHG